MFHWKRLPMVPRNQTCYKRTGDIWYVPPSSTTQQQCWSLVESRTYHHHALYSQCHPDLLYSVWCHFKQHSGSWEYCFVETGESFLVSLFFSFYSFASNTSTRRMGASVILLNLKYLKWNIKQSVDPIVPVDPDVAFCKNICKSAQDCVNQCEIALKATRDMLRNLREQDTITNNQELMLITFLQERVKHYSGTKSPLDAWKAAKRDLNDRISDTMIANMEIDI